MSFFFSAIKSSALRRVVGISGHIIRKNQSTCQEAEAQNIGKTTNNHFKYGVQMIPHPEKVAKGGEDAYHIGKNILAVADGVGGWADVGVDPGKYSKELCQNIKNLVHAKWDNYKVNPKNLIIEAAHLTKSEGSSTLCIVTLDENHPILHAAYIGDSGYMILRKTDNGDVNIITKSEEHCRSFNFPYQIGTHGDPPQMSLALKHKIANNDILIVGSDGLFDNLDDSQIKNCVKPFVQYTEDILDIQVVAEAIAQYAFKMSLDPVVMSPFAKRARENYYDFRGGKSDDITVLVGQIKLQSKKE